MFIYVCIYEYTLVSVVKLWEFFLGRGGEYRVRYCTWLLSVGGIGRDFF